MRSLYFKKPFTNYLSNLDYVVHTVLLEKTHFTENNKVGRNQDPISISLGAYFILLKDVSHGLSKLYQAHLHYPVDKIEMIKEMDAVYLSHFKELIFYMGKSTPLYFTDAKESHISTLRK